MNHCSVLCISERGEISRVISACSPQYWTHHPIKIL